MEIKRFVLFRVLYTYVWYFFFFLISRHHRRYMKQPTQIKRGSPKVGKLRSAILTNFLFLPNW